ncbi:hypothetical protein BD324DRAFT_616170 [Kockovaella imperatae]|uniref:Mtf2-like C-terminal domain-containing protein n=1 Tax=Kockovaella imperatae TaxID=4999 RepID=A0A1Y1UR69_9TREE|nr:hypothetical protein BD324DRAFT_616170 [Kockovaella imperatae]ORX40077.1 hypothetical protein BD324DRAFT_616170 [Kockovaella imperatae]
MSAPVPRLRGHLLRSAASLAGASSRIGEPSVSKNCSCGRFVGSSTIPARSIGRSLLVSAFDAGRNCHARAYSTDSIGKAGPDASSSLAGSSTSSSNFQDARYQHFQASLANIDANNQSRARVFKGVHSRRDRAKGTTPQEAKALNQVIAGLYRELERLGGPLRPGSNPVTDPFSHNLADSPRSGDSLRSMIGVPRFAKRTDDGLGGAELAKLRSEIDMLKEDMSTLSSEQDLVEWAERHVFTPSEVSDGEELGYPRRYPHMLAYLMRITREIYRNPSLALAFFQHAQTLSLESYMSGCLTSAYNELIRTRWQCFRDLEGVDQALKEMETSGVSWNFHTRQLVESVCNSVSSTPFSTERGEEESIWKEFVMKRWRTLEARLDADSNASEGMWDRMAEAKRMERGLNLDSERARERYGSSDNRQKGGIIPQSQRRPERRSSESLSHNSVYQDEWQAGHDEDAPHRAYG